jgi:alpha-galactosidase
MTEAYVHLRAAGVSVLLDTSLSDVPVLRHWGADLGDALPHPSAWVRPVAHSAPDEPRPATLLGGGLATPALRGSRDGRDWAPRWSAPDVERPDAATAVVRLRDPSAQLTLTTTLALDVHGVLTHRSVLRNDGAEPYRLERLGAVLPVPHRATELLDLTGRWARERHPQRHAFTAQGTWQRSSRSGRTGHDATLLLVAGTAGFGNRNGEVWAVHLAWSGNHVTYAERRPDGLAVLGVAELLEPGEVVLGPGEEYETPVTHAAYAGEGLDGLSARLHGSIRARPHHPASPRPVVLNTWEAVYFDHRLDRLTALADVAAGVGVERFVLDDGWFRGRRDDGAGLGDWEVDPAVWPDGLDPLVENVRGLGMQFGLWVEPEMVNLDSELYRAHPDWVLRPQDDLGALPAEWRRQQVLDLSVPQAWQHVHDALDALLREHDIGYLKWDHNRDLVEAGHEGRPAAHRQTLAVYRLLDALRDAHPGVEIESCASGGARVDLGILDRSDRVWASDSNDALERATIQRWTQLLLPPELVGSHVGPTTSHTTGRTHALSFRGAVALFGHFGIEWDIASLDEEELAALTRLVSTYRRHRGLLHTGTVVHGDHPDPAAVVHGVVASDRAEALMAYLSVATSATEVPVPVRLPGLDPDRTYAVSSVDTGGAPLAVQRRPPAWSTVDGFQVRGRFLGEVGLQLPALAPEQALVLHLRAV